MTPITRVLAVAALLALAGCGTDQTSNYSQQPILGQMDAPSQGDYADTLNTDNSTMAAPPPSQQVASGVQNLSISSFVDPAGLSLMGPGAQSQAASAQYYALQFGRVGAARTWTGENNVTGSISVGPYVKVNNRDCRDFTNIVNAGSKSYTKRGTACREADGTWTVGSATAGAAPATGAGTPVTQPAANAG
ncbi:MAG TPA: hypothetical protein VHB74_14710 [Devosia sp.]|nr:hypothetical protein [Devosia sp.]